MNRFILGLGLFLLTATAWAQRGPPEGRICVSTTAIRDCTGLDDQTLEVDAGERTT